MRAALTGIGKDGRRFSQMLFASAGMGASSMRDGLSTTAFPTNSGAGSIEAMEAITPLVFTRKEYRVDSGGPGRFRGGLGQTVGIANITDRPMHLFLIADRAHHPAQGILGGGPGAAAVVTIGSGKSLSLKSKNVLAPGDTVTLSFPGGGGYGDPAQRLHEAIAADMESGFVTEEAARRDYAPGATEASGAN
jgi:N-methylhydantoinase B